MESFFEKTYGVFLMIWEYLRHIMDILGVALIFYWVYVFFSRTRAIQLLKGVIIIFIVAGLSLFLGLDTLNWLIEKFVIYGVIALIILFQPELRRMITQFGQRNWITYDSMKDTFPLDEIVNALLSMSAERIGSLLVIERNTGLRSYVESGIPVNSNISEEIIRTIFYPLTPLHDGAIIVQEGKIAAAACYLPLSDSKALKKHHGARHRAALGIAEETDALVLMTSEETGSVSIMVNGRIFSKIKTTDIKNMIIYFLNPKTAYEGTYRII